MGPARGNCGPEDIAAQSAVAMHKRAAKEPAGSERLGVCAAPGAARMESVTWAKMVGACVVREETLEPTQNLRDSDCALSEANYIIGVDNEVCVPPHVRAVGGRHRPAATCCK